VCENPKVAGAEILTVGWVVTVGNVVEDISAIGDHRTSPIVQVNRVEINDLIAGFVLRGSVMGNVFAVRQEEGVRK
jgi:hypothetical protein